MSLSRQLTKTEKILVAFLAVIILGMAYFFLVYTPISTRITEIESALVAADDELIKLEEQQKRIVTMEAEIAKAKAAPKIIEAPDYDNVKNVMAMLNSIMVGTRGYNISFNALAEVDLGNGIIRRQGKMTYLANNYQQAKDIFSQLYSGPYRCLISEMVVSANATGTGNEENATLERSNVQVDFTITYYEVKSQEMPEIPVVTS